MTSWLHEIVVVVVVVVVVDNVVVYVRSVVDTLLTADVVSRSNRDPGVPHCTSAIATIRHGVADAAVDIDGTSSGDSDSDGGLLRLGVRSTAAVARDVTIASSHTRLHRLSCDRKSVKAVGGARRVWTQQLPQLVRSLRLGRQRVVTACCTLRAVPVGTGRCWSLRRRAVHDPVVRVIVWSIAVQPLQQMTNDRPCSRQRTTSALSSSGTIGTSKASGAGVTTATATSTSTAVMTTTLTWAGDGCPLPGTAANPFAGAVTGTTTRSC